MDGEVIQKISNLFSKKDNISSANEQLKRIDILMNYTYGHTKNYEQYKENVINTFHDPVTLDYIENTFNMISDVQEDIEDDLLFVKHHFQVNTYSADSNKRAVWNNRVGYYIGLFGYYIKNYFLFNKIF